MRVARKKKKVKSSFKMVKGKSTKVKTPINKDTYSGMKYAFKAGLNAGSTMKKKN